MNAKKVILLGIMLVNGCFLISKAVIQESDQLDHQNQFKNSCQENKDCCTKKFSFQDSNSYQAMVQDYFANLPSIETERLFLRPPCSDDAAHLHKLFKDAGDNFFESQIKLYGQGKPVPWTLCLKSKEYEPIGYCGIDSIKGEGIAYCIYSTLKEYRGSVLAYFEEAMSMIVDHLFRTGFVKIIVMDVRCFEDAYRLVPLNFRLEKYVARVYSSYEVFYRCLIKSGLEESSEMSQKAACSVDELSKTPGFDCENCYQTPDYDPNNCCQTPQ